MTSAWLVASADVDQGSTLEVRCVGAAARAVTDRGPALVADGVAGKISRRDPGLWGEAARAESEIRLAWVDLAVNSRPLVERIQRLRAELASESIDRVVLCGMGGSSLAPEVITRTADVPLVVLDGTDPAQVRAAVQEQLARTVVVVSSKSGSTVETDSQRRAFEAAFSEAGIDPLRRIVVVTDPGSPLEKASLEAGYRAVFTADPQVGGRFSALSAFGLVPSGLAGADVGRLLDEARAAMGPLSADTADNPGLVLGAALGGTAPLRDKLIFVDEGSGIVGFADWAEQLIAESTGKNSTGLLPVVVSGPAAPEVRSPGDDALLVRLVPSGVEPAAGEGGSAVAVSGPLGAQLLLWEYATAVSGRLLGISPFDQPDVESAKKAARSLLDARPEPVPAHLVDGPVEIRATEGLLDGVTDLPGAVAALGKQVGPTGYLAVMAYLDRLGDADLAEVRDPLAARVQRPVTFGWGPRFLHSTGQYHKGGPAVGVYLQITGGTGEDLAVPERPFTFGQLIAAQAAGDAQVLADLGRPVLRLHLTDRAAGLALLREVLGA
ncbi:MAG: glucose-6-phosphate isomerase [Actinomycetota bacterium]|nr:glucose-6-phosphate isomerase [Actinomycetota bacterium]MDQ1294686.1 glucose-6-phosphate isomerase [Actinomycetota bacterium]